MDDILGGFAVPQLQPQRSAVALAAPWAPDQMKSLHLWLDGTDATTLFQDSAGTSKVTATGQYINGWRDKGPSRLLLANANTSSTYTPTFADTGLGYNSVSFPGATNQPLRAVLDGSHLSAYTWFLAVKNNSAETDWQFCWSLGKDTTPPYNGQDGIGLQHTWQDYEWLSDCREDSSDALGVSSGGSGTMPTGFHTVYGQFDFAPESATESLWVQNTLVGSDTGAKGDQAYIAPNKVAMGGRTESEFNGSAVHILTFIGYSRALDAAERTRVLTYIRSRFKVT